MVVDLIVNRELRMWRYGVSHSELVLMSTNDVGEYETRFFVLLKPVHFISLPNSFECSRIRSVKLDRSTKFEFVTDTAVYYVLADKLFHGEDNKPWHARIPFGLDAIETDMLRRDAISRLMLGAAVCLPVVAERAVHNRAFLIVQPIMHAEHGNRSDRDRGGEPLLHRAEPGSDAITGYELIHRELRPGWDARPGDWIEFLESEKRLEFSSVEALEANLQQLWRVGLEDFMRPDDLELPF